MSKIFYNGGATFDIGCDLILVYHAINSMIHHSPIHIALLLFALGKTFAKLIQLPYQWNLYSARIKCLINIYTYSIITALYFYGIFVMKL